MQNFVFHNPTKVLFGRGILKNLGEETRLLGKRVLLVFGCNSLQASGTYARIRENLTRSNLPCLDFGGVQANPTLTHVREGIRLAKKEKIEVILAAGGGSVLDSAKAIGAGVIVEHDVWKFFTCKRGIQGSLPVITVPTMAASGSEMNSGMVLTHEEKQQKFGFGHKALFPKTSFLDPELTFTVSPQQTAYGAVDCISHLLEYYCNSQASNTGLQDNMITGLIRSAMEACEHCLRDPHHYASRAQLLWISSLALNGMISAGLGRVAFPMHLLEHSLSALYGLAHGAGLAVIMPTWLNWYWQQGDVQAQRLAALGQAVFPHDTLQSTNLEAQARHCITCIQSWLEQIGMPGCLADCGLDHTCIAPLANNAQAQAKIWRMREYTPERIASVFSCEPTK